MWGSVKYCYLCWVFFFLIPLSATGSSSSVAVTSLPSLTALFFPSFFKKEAWGTKGSGSEQALVAAWRREVNDWKRKEQGGCFVTWVEHIYSVHLVFLFWGRLGKDCQPLQHSALVRRGPMVSSSLKDLHLGSNCAEGVARHAVWSLVFDGIVL